jgi:chromate transporter
METKLTNISFKEAVKVWVRVALNSFGGPAGQISVMHKIIVEEKKWIDNDRFLHALNYCMLLPGPEAQQLATYIGWLLHKFKGGIIAGSLFVLPGFISILLLSVFYTLYQDTAFLNSLFFGLKAAVIAIVLEALFRIGKKALKNLLMYLIAAASFIAIFFFNVPFPFIILAAGLTGLIGSGFRKIKEPEDVKREFKFRSYAPEVKNSVLYLLKTFLVFGGLWLTPVILLVLFQGTDNVFSRLGIFFSTAAVVTFGGAYAVLAYISQEAVQTYGWLYPGEMLDGLGMAETTPGPLIQVVQFVGFLGAYRLAGGMDPLMAGVLAAFLVTWVTFMPSFLWIFMGAPFMEKLREVKWLNSALSGVTAAVTGVILNLSIWFFIHTAFGKVDTEYYGILRLYIPSLETLNPGVLILSAAAFFALIYLKWGLFRVLAISVAAGFIWNMMW